MHLTGPMAEPASGRTSRFGGLALTTCDLDAARDHVGRVFVDHKLVLSPGHRALDFRHRHAAIADLSLNRLQYGAPVTVEAPALTDFYLLQFTLRGVCEIRCGADRLLLPRGTLLVMNPTRPYHKRWSADCQQLIIRIEKELIERQLAALIDRDARRPVEFAFRAVDTGRDGVQLTRFAEMLASQLGTERGTFHPLVRRQMAEGLAALLLTTLDHTHRPAMDAPISPAAPFFVRRAEEYIRAHACADLTLADIAQAAGVSARTLHRGFQRFRDTSPMGYLKDVRLDLARSALGSSGRTVTDVANACGLLHAGKFARDYKRRFGESPSETRRRGRRI